MAAAGRRPEQTARSAWLGCPGPASKGGLPLPCVPGNVPARGNQRLFRPCLLNRSTAPQRNTDRAGARTASGLALVVVPWLGPGSRSLAWTPWSTCLTVAAPETTQGSSGLLPRPCHSLLSVRPDEGVCEGLRQGRPCPCWNRIRLHLVRPKAKKLGNPALKSKPA